MAIDGKHIYECIARARDLADMPIEVIRKIACTSDNPSKKNLRDEFRGQSRGKLIEAILMDEFDVDNLEQEDFEE
jgi:hypothetical protein